jgi:hypothetical protein
MSDLLKKAGDMAGKIADKTTEVAKAAGQAATEMGGKVVESAADTAKVLADKTSDAAKAAGDALKK